MRARYQTDQVDTERFDVPSDPRGWTTTLAVTNPDYLEQRYREFLFGRLEESRRALEAKLVPAIEDMSQPLEARADGYRADISIAGIIQHLLRMLKLAWRLLTQSRPTAPKDRILSIGESVSEHNKTELKDDFGRIAKVQPEFAEGDTEQRLQAFARENLDLIQDVDRQPFDELSEELVQAVREGKRPKAIEDLVQERLDVTESRAELIARDQISKLNSDFNRVRQRNNGIERYEWMSAADRRVRTKHKFLHGEIRQWSNPHPTEGHPGDPIQCRCVARGIIADLVSDDVRQAESKAPQFDVPDVRDRRYNYNPNWSTDDKAKYLQNEWVHGSWNEEPTAMKQAAAREFGFDEERVWNPKGHEPDDALVDDMTDVVAHQYQKAQDELDRRGIDSVTLYRGLSSDVEQQGVLSSWTQSKEVAKSFDDYIVEEEIPADRVLFFKGGPSWQDGKFGNQEEWVVLPEKPGEVGDDEPLPEASDSPDDTNVGASAGSSSVPGDEDEGISGASGGVAEGGDVGSGVSPGRRELATMSGESGSEFHTPAPFDADSAGYLDGPDLDKDWNVEGKTLKGSINQALNRSDEALKERIKHALGGLQKRGLDGDAIAWDEGVHEVVSRLAKDEGEARGALAELERALYVAENRSLASDTSIHLDVNASEIDGSRIGNIEAPDSDEVGPLDADVYYKTSDDTLHAEQVKANAGTLKDNPPLDQIDRLERWMEAEEGRQACLVLGDGGEFQKVLSKDVVESVVDKTDDEFVLAAPSESGGFSEVTFDELSDLEDTKSDDFTERLADGEDAKDIRDDWFTLEAALQRARGQ
ncbi:MAG: minor capsid protein [Bradymonadaceae bacterium]